MIMPRPAVTIRHQRKVEMKLSLLLATCILFASPSVVVADTPAPATVKVTKLLSSTATSNGDPIVLPSKNAEVEVSIYEIPVGATLPEHQHPFPRYGYMLAGTLRITNTETGKSAEYNAGDFILETIGHWHRAQNIGNETIRLVVIDQVEKGRENTILRK
jgi:quercetin dioxygenase-like cupin family protein